MKKITCIKYNKYREIKNLLMSNIFNKTLVLSIIGYRCGRIGGKLFREEQSIQNFRLN